MTDAPAPRTRVRSTAPAGAAPAVPVVRMRDGTTSPMTTTSAAAPRRAVPVSNPLQNDKSELTATMAAIGKAMGPKV